MSRMAPGGFLALAAFGLSSLGSLPGCADEIKYRTDPCPCEGIADSDPGSETGLAGDSADSGSDSGVEPGTPLPATITAGDSGHFIESLAMNFVEVTAGEFTMGCTPAQEDSCETDEVPAHRVTLTRAFWVATTEVTQWQYQAVMGEHRSGHDTCGDDCPVAVITWHQAASFTNGLSDLEGLERCYECEETETKPVCSPVADPYACMGYRLATEAEWEAAARCGTDLMFAGSDEFSEVAWTATNADATTHPVGTLAPNHCGIHDMSGNVWEWVGDWFDDYPSGPVIDPFGPEEEVLRGYRGGSWGNSTRRSRASNRHMRPPTFHYSLLGARVFRTPP